MATRPSTRKGTATVRPGQGIKVNHIYYWHDAFRNPEVERIQVPVRYDPFDIGVAYAFVQHRWVQCLSQYFAQLHGHSEKALLLASAELRQRQPRPTTRITAKHLAEFLAKANYVGREIADRRFYKRPGKWCSWCDYLPVCVKDEKRIKETLVKVTYSQ